MHRRLLVLVEGLALLALSGCGGVASSPAAAIPSPAHIGVTEAYQVVIDVTGRLLVPAGHSYQVVAIEPRDGRVTVLAGNGGATYSGGAGQASSLAIGLPRSVAAGNDGSIYIAAAGTGVLRVDPATQRLEVLVAMTSYAGAAATTDRIDDPLALAVDSRGNLFIADGDRVRRLDATTRALTTIAGTGAAGLSGDGGPARLAMISHPHGIATDATGALLIADTGNQLVRRISPDGQIDSVSMGQLNTPTGVSVALDGSLVVADFGNSRVLRRTAAGTVTTLADGLVGADSAVIAADGTVYVATLGAGIIRIGGDGKRTTL